MRISALIIHKYLLSSSPVEGDVVTRPQTNLQTHGLNTASDTFWFFTQKRLRTSGHFKRALGRDHESLTYPKLDGGKGAGGVPPQLVHDPGHFFGHLPVHSQRIGSVQIALVEVPWKGLIVIRCS